MQHWGDDYNAVAKLLHWSIAAFVIMLLIMGFTMTRISDLQLKFSLYQLHKSMGITVLGLMVLRLGWRIIAKPPAMPSTMPRWEKNAAHATHASLYILLLLMPLLGWALVSAASFNLPTLLYGAVPWPHLPILAELSAEQKKTVEPLLKNVHGIGGWLVLALVLLHLAAALRHGLILKDGVMSRMLPRFFNLSAKLTLPFLIALGFSVASIGHAPAMEWSVDKEKSRISFEASAGGQIVTGEFKQYQMEVRFDPEDPEISEIAAAIDMKSAETGQPQVDEALKAKDWFDAVNYPVAYFKATSIEESDQDGVDYEMKGDLTIRSETKTVSAPFTLNIDSGEANGRAEIEINRLAFRVGPQDPVSGMVIDETVKIIVEVNAVRLDN